LDCTGDDNSENRFSPLSGRFRVSGLASERLVPAKSKVSFRLFASFHAVPANAGYVWRTLKGEPPLARSKKWFEIDHSLISTNFATPLQRNRNLHNGAHAKSIAVSWSEKFPALN
jgi:hypothetical protein